MDPAIETNQKLWDELAPLHAASDHYDVASFLRGESKLGELEVAEVGDVAGKRLVHLMCHFGLDTLSWARLGADVTGIDFSAEALRIATHLAERVNVDARFVCCDVLRAADELYETFDVVFLSKGVMMWIPDITSFARTCAGLLAPGGIFYLLDFHPLANALSQSSEGLRLHGSYFHTPEPAVVVSDGSYAVADTGLAHRESREWTHPLGDIVTALVAEGIAIEFLHEFPAAATQGMPVPQLDTEFTRHVLPAMFSIRGIRS